MMAFHCPANQVQLEAGETRKVQFLYLPFTMGRRQCTVIFSDRSVGEFICRIDGVATLPEASPLPFQNSGASITSSAAAGRGNNALFYIFCIKSVQELLRVHATWYLCTFSILCFQTSIKTTSSETMHACTYYPSAYWVSNIDMNKKVFHPSTHYIAFETFETKIKIMPSTVSVKT